MEKSIEHFILVDRASILLKASGVPRMPVSDFSKKSRGFVYYFYSPSTISTILSFLQDQLDYISQVKNQAGDRRVVFLLTSNSEDIVAVYLQFKNIDRDKLSALLNSLTERGNVVLEQNTISAIQMLYQNVSCVIYQPDSYKIAPGFITQAFPHATVTRQNFFIDNSSEMLSECLLQHLTTGKIDAFDVGTVTERFRLNCADSLISSMNAFQENNPADHKKIIKRLHIVMKYAALIATRPKHSLEDAWLSQLEEIQQRDKQLKKIIFLPTDLNIQHAKEMSLTTLMQLARHETSADLLAWLNGSRDEMFGALQKWEIELQEKISSLQKSWSSISASFAIKTGKYLYQHSFVGFGAMVSRTGAKQITENPYGLMISQGVGGLAGLGYTYFSGSYALARMVLVSFFGDTLEEMLGNAKVDDRKAKVILPKFEGIGRLGLVRLTSLLWAALESYFMHDFSYLMKATAGTLSSVGVTSLAKNAIPSTDVNNVSEEQMLLLFFVSLAGQEFGSKCIEWISYGLEQWFSPEILDNGFKAQTNSETCPASFWFQKNDDLRFQCTHKETLRNVSLYCENPQVMMSKR